MKLPLAAFSLACSVALVAGCSAGESAAPAQSSTSSSSSPASLTTTSATPTPTPTPKPKPVDTTSPLSGRPNGAGKPVVVVKIDNTVAAQPHSGLTKADIVYLEEVEWGLTRIAAVFSTRIPQAVGPVRSARITDVELFEPWGDIAFAYSGAQKRMVKVLNKTDFHLFSNDAGAPGYWRSSKKVAPWNLYLNLETVVDKAPGAAKAQNVGFVFDEKAPAGGRKTNYVKASWPASSAAFTWEPSSGTYSVRLNGRPEVVTENPGRVSPTTIVVQYVKMKDSGFGDKFGGRTPLSITRGSGKGIVLRNGLSYPVTWRQDAAGRTLFAGQNGKPLPFDPGQVWVLLVNRNAPVKTS